MEQRKEKLHEALKPELSGTRGEQQLGALLEEYHEVFSLGKDDRGETDMIELHIDTGDAAPQKYLVRRVPFAVTRNARFSNLQIALGLVPCF